MLFDFANVAVFFVFGVVFVVAQLMLTKVFAPKAPSYEKSIPYECGEVPQGTPWIRFNPRYYMIALIFLIFDVEVTFMYPCAVAFRKFIETHQMGWLAFAEIFSFVGILLVGLIYVWRKSDLTWIKDLSVLKDEEIRLTSSSTLKRASR